MERFIHHLRVERPASTETAAGARERLGGRFPRGAARRMTHLGMLIGAAFEDLALTPDDAVVYATTFAETRALEDFLGSFPAASPLLFQTSIHPGGVQQVLIGRQQQAARLWPLAGRERLVEQALLAALLETAARVVVAGGEERGTWLLDHGMASDRAFAFAFLLTREPEGSIGRLGLEPAAGTVRDAPVESCPTLPEFADGLAERRSFGWQGLEGAWRLGWR
jgi:hypothetical protein